MPSFSNLLLGCVANVANSCLLKRIFNFYPVKKKIINLKIEIEKSELIENYRTNPNCSIFALVQLEKCGAGQIQVES